MRKDFVRLMAITAVVGCLGNVRPALAVTKLIGDFEGTMASPYTTSVALPATENGGCAQGAGTVSWCTDGGITVPAQFVTADDPIYGEGVTHGNQALLFTFPGNWGNQPGPFLRLHGMAPLMGDYANFPYLLFDVTTFTRPDTPEEDYPEWRQVFAITNTPAAADGGVGWYDASLGDQDVQRAITVASGDEVFLTQTIYSDMTASVDDSGIPDDDKNAMQALAQIIKADHEDGTPINNFVWHTVFVFQGKDIDQPFGEQVEIVIDNIRFCSDSLEVCQAAAPEGLAGDYNDDHKVDAADYTVWRNQLGGSSLTNETVTLGIVDGADYTEWKSHFGTSGGSGSSGLAPVPEPSSILLILGAVAAAATFCRMRESSPI
jgi:hypothetical protein